MPTFVIPITTQDTQALVKFPVMGMGGLEIEVFMSALATVAPMFSSDHTKDLVVVSCPLAMAEAVSKAFEGFPYPSRVVPTEGDPFLSTEDVVLRDEAPQDSLVVIEPRQMVLSSPAGIRTLRHLMASHTVPCVELCHANGTGALFNCHREDNAGVHAFRHAKRAYIAAKRAAETPTGVTMDHVVFQHDGYPKSVPFYLENVVPLRTVAEVEAFRAQQMGVPY